MQKSAGRILFSLSLTNDLACSPYDEGAIGLVIEAFMYFEEEMLPLSEATSLAQQRRGRAYSVLFNLDKHGLLRGRADQEILVASVAFALKLAMEQDEDRS